MVVSRKTLIAFGYIMEPPESIPNEKSREYAIDVELNFD